MSTVILQRAIDLEALPFPVHAVTSSGETYVTADVPEPDLQAAVDAAPDAPPPPPPAAERIEALEAQAEATNARMDAAIALADQANATAQEVAQAMRDARPAKP